MANQSQNPEQKSLEKGRKSETPSQYASWMTSPFSFMRRFSEEMDRLFEDFGFGGQLARSTGGEISPRDFGRGLWRPPIEVAAKGDNLIVRADLPGLSKEDIKVECTNDAITIQGERKHEKTEESEGEYHSERVYGKFFRRIPLPEGTRPDDAKAVFRDGVLEITLKAPKQEKTREITIGE